MDGKAPGLQKTNLNGKTVMKLIKNNFCTILLKGRKDTLQGILIYAGIEWVLLKYVPVDYVLDGYLIIRNRYIKKIERGEDEIFNETVIHLKWTVEKFEGEFPNLNGYLDILYYLMQKQTVIQFDFHDDSISYIGKIKKIHTKTMRIESMNPKGEWDGESSYLLERVRTIQFDNDYINSLIAYNKYIESLK
ncbi:MAG: hypothetical protein LBN74_09315 [Prevotella sp.]|jgi:hypothetical protein|nr:hypothetical protein [Prevotella sp.]